VGLTLPPVTTAQSRATETTQATSKIRISQSVHAKHEALHAALAEAMQAPGRGGGAIEGMEKEQPGTYWKGQIVTCSLDTWNGQQVWLCGNPVDECDRLMQAEQTVNELWGIIERRGTLLPEGEGWYEEWPSGRRLYCDKAFGCRELH
jgi:hypothetical protein